MSTAKITFKRIDKRVEKQSLQVFRKISNLIENQSRSSKKRTKSWRYIKLKKLCKNHRKPNARNSKPKMRKTITKKPKRRKSVNFAHHQSACEQLTSHSINVNPLFCNNKAQPNVHNFRKQKK